MFHCLAHDLKIGNNEKPAANREDLLGSEDFSAEEKQFGQSEYSVGVSAELLEHRQHETMVLFVNPVVCFQPQPQ